jgi:hypothetical protein
MRTGNADQSIFNSLLNLASRESFTDKRVDCHFYVTSFYHPIKNTVGISFHIFSITPRLYPRWSATKQHHKNPKVDNPIPIHDPLGWQTALTFGKSKDTTHDALIRVYDAAGNVIETHGGDFNRAADDLIIGLNFLET